MILFYVNWESEKIKLEGFANFVTDFFVISECFEKNLILVALCCFLLALLSGFLIVGNKNPLNSVPGLAIYEF